MTIAVICEDGGRWGYRLAGVLDGEPWRLESAVVYPSEAGARRQAERVRAYIASGATW